MAQPLEVGLIAGPLLLVVAYPGPRLNQLALHHVAAESAGSAPCHLENILFQLFQLGILAQHAFMLNADRYYYYYYYYCCYYYY